MLEKNFLAAVDNNGTIVIRNYIYEGVVRFVNWRNYASVPGQRPDLRE